MALLYFRSMRLPMLLKLLMFLKLLVLLVLPLTAWSQIVNGTSGSARGDSVLTNNTATDSIRAAISQDSARLVAGRSLVSEPISMTAITTLPPVASRKKTSRNANLEGVVLTYQMDFLRGLAGAPVQLRQLRSGGFSVTIYFNQKLGKSKFSYAAGAGLSARNYFSNLRDWQTGAVWPDSPEVKNKHVFTTYEVVPFELRYTQRLGNSNKSLKVSAGLNVGYTASLSSKSELGSLTEKYKGRADLLDLNPWRTAVIGRVGYHRLGLSVYYGLNDWFRTNAINGRPWSVGMSLLL